VSHDARNGDPRVIERSEVTWRQDRLRPDTNRLAIAIRIEGREPDMRASGPIA
jgi:hypothetical protein